MEAMAPGLPVLRTAYLIERDFAEFYEMAAGKSQGEAKQVLEMLARWELCFPTPRNGCQGKRRWPQEGRLDAAAMFVLAILVSAFIGVGVIFCTTALAGGISIKDAAGVAAFSTGLPKVSIQAQNS